MPLLLKSCGGPLLPLFPRFVSHHHLRIAAHSYSCFLPLLLSELLVAFLVLNVNDIGQRIQRLHFWSPSACIEEAAWKVQVNHVPFSTAIWDVREATACLKARPQWRATTLVCSIRKDNHHSDPRGFAKKSFDHHGLAHCNRAIFFDP